MTIAPQPTPSPAPLRIATRQSPLALWQAEHVRARLEALASGRAISLLPMTTDGDRWLDSPLSKLGGKNLFVKELERAMLEGQAELAVHSMKDVAAELPDGLGIASVLEREDPHDALVGPLGGEPLRGLDDLPDGARVGTCSLRRRSQLLARRPDLRIGMLRGNVNTRLAKLDDGQHDAIVLAAAGLMRLGLEQRIGARLDRTACLPAIGQGIVGIEARDDDRDTRALLEALHHPPTACRLAAERTVSRRLNGGCSAPLAGHARWEGETLILDARVASLDGRTVLHEHASARIEPVDGDAQVAIEAATALGERVARALLEAGAADVLEKAARDVETESA